MQTGNILIVMVSTSKKLFINSGAKFDAIMANLCQYRKHLYLKIKSSTGNDRPAPEPD
jgi:hypothetical protein